MKGEWRARYLPVHRRDPDIHAVEDLQPAPPVAVDGDPRVIRFSLNEEITRPDPCRFCAGTGLSGGEDCTNCCGLKVDGADWWWEIRWQREQRHQAYVEIARLRAVIQDHNDEAQLQLTRLRQLVQDWPMSSMLAAAKADAFTAAAGQVMGIAGTRALRRREIADWLRKLATDATRGS